MMSASANTTFRQKVIRLRSLEHYAYQIAYFVLQSDKPAERAVQKALLEISKRENLLHGKTEELLEMVKKEVIRAALCPA